MPIVLTIVLFIQRQFYVKDTKYLLPFGHIVIAVLFFGLIFEIIYPCFTDRYTGDIYDLFAYAVGALIFYKWVNCYI